MFPTSIKKTQARVAVYRYLEQQTIPKSAQEIYDDLKADDHEIWLSTIYRVLEVFLKHRVVNQMTLANPQVTLFSLATNKHEHYAICTNCKDKIPLPCCMLDQYQDTLNKKGFKVESHRIEIYGICDHCLNSLNDNKNVTK